MRLIGADNAWRDVLRATTRKKDGKEHRYWSVVENPRVAGGRVVQRHVCSISGRSTPHRNSLGVARSRGSTRTRALALFPEDRCEAPCTTRRYDSAAAAVAACAASAAAVGGVLARAGAPQELGLDEFWAERLSASRKGSRWDRVLFVLTAYRLLAPGSEWRLHREGFGRTALADFLGGDERLAESHALYACHDRLLEHQQALFTHLAQRWRGLFNAGFDVLLYDLTSTYFESDPPFDENDKRRHGYSRDHRGDCVQVIA